MNIRSVHLMDRPTPPGRNPTAFRLTLAEAFQAAATMSENRQT